MLPVHRRALVVRCIHAGRAHRPVFGILIVAFVKRPSEILRRAGRHLHVFICPPADIADIKDARIAIRRRVGAGARLEREAARIAQADGPDARACRARTARLVIRIAGHAVAGGGINAEQLAAERVEHLTAKGSVILPRRDNAVRQRLRSVSSARRAAIVHRRETRAVAAAHHQRAVRAKHQRADTVRSMHDGKPRGDRLAQQHQPRRRVHGAEVIRAPRRVAREPPDRRL